MAEVNHQPPVFQFGAFELDAHSGELRKHGIKLKLQRQPLQVLAILLERPGEVVMREEIQKRLWPDNTYVDFDNAINSAMRKLRDALGDTAENARFIETLARRGCRFIYPISGGIRVIPVELPKATRKEHRTPWFALSALAAAALAIVALTLWLRSRHPAVATEMGTLHRITSDDGLTTDPAVSRDGTLLAYASDRSGEGHLNLWVQELRGGQAIRLTHSDADDHEPSFSPDGTQIAFRSELNGGGVYLVPSLGGLARLVTPQGRTPRFSPDGKLIAYWVGLEWGSRMGVAAGRVYVVPSSGGVPREVSTGLAIAGAPVWSPDGKYLLVFGEKNLDPHFAESPDWWILSVGGGIPICTRAYASFASRDLGITKLDTMPYPTDWVDNRILFSAKLGDAIDLWQIPIRAGTWQINGRAERMTSLAGSAVSSSLTSDGRIVFANLSQQTHLWMLPMETNRGIVKGAPRQLTYSDAAEYWPSVSADGRRLAFTSTRNGKEDIWLKDLQTGAETRIPPTGDRQEFPKVSHDGRRLAFTVVEGQGEIQQKASIYILSLDDMRFHNVLENGDWVWTWSPDDRYLLCKWGATRYAQLLDPASGRAREFLRDPNANLFQLTFSPDGRWVAFNQMSGIFVAPYQGPDAIPKRDWMHITGGDFFDDKPRWSPDGSLIFFTSARDGSRCLWMQRLNPETKSPVGVPVPVHHLHFGRRSVANVGAALADIAVVRDGVILPQTELKGNVWMTTTRK